jgi:hypothetical protein
MVSSCVSEVSDIARPPLRDPTVRSLLSGIRSLLPPSSRNSDNSAWDQRRIAPYSSEEVDVYECVDRRRLP